LFCVPKAAVLHGKSVGFALQNSRFRNAKSKLVFLSELSLQNDGDFIIHLSSEFDNEKLL